MPAEIAILLAKQEFPCTQEVKVTGYAEVPLPDDFEGDKAEAFMLVQNDTNLSGRKPTISIVG